MPGYFAMRRPGNVCANTHFHRKILTNSIGQSWVGRGRPILGGICLFFQGVEITTLNFSCASDFSGIVLSNILSIIQGGPMTDANDQSKKTAPVPSGLRKGLTSYGDSGFSLFLRKAFIKGAGYSDSALDRPVIGIANTGSAFNPCHGNMPQLIEAVKRGVMLAGGLPMDFPTISVHESFASPTSMYLRNLMSMDTEEMIRAQA